MKHACDTVTEQSARLNLNFQPIIGALFFENIFVDLGFNVPPTAKFILGQDLGLKDSSDRLEKSESVNLLPLVY